MNIHHWNFVSSLSDSIFDALAEFYGSTPLIYFYKRCYVQKERIGGSQDGAEMDPEVPVEAVNF